MYTCAYRYSDSILPNKKPDLYLCLLFDYNKCVIYRY